MKAWKNLLNKVIFPKAVPVICSKTAKLQIISIMNKVPVVLGTLKMHTQRWFLLQGDLDRSGFLNQQQVKRDREVACAMQRVRHDTVIDVCALNT